ncbi:MULTISPECIES: DoxX family protein [Bacteroidota]|uniref:DoxX family protein n=1 Tax=Bacteroidota TaxID=976 RepID=UPI00258010AD|nr:MULTISPECIES: DoxX family protein [Bacteroidota]
MFQRIVYTDNAGTTIIIRLMVGAVFLSEGIQKFLFADKLGTGRFVKIGLPNPGFLGPFVGSFEITCGILVLLGLFTRLSAIPLLVIMLVAMAATKLQLYLDNGFWSMLHDSRTDWAMLLGCIFLIIKGGGKWSLDQSLWKKRKGI